MRVRWTTDAANDVERICDYTAGTSPNSARRVAQTVVEGVASLDTFPNRGRPGRVEGTRERRPHTKGADRARRYHVRWSRRTEERSLHRHRPVIGTASADGHSTFVRPACRTALRRRRSDLASRCRRTPDWRGMTRF
ncbi:MAG: type II toxin-antitoxin system RelE/ParE family toxin [Acidobacteria bacterium]|nr:type II toxin-antitoxin system RelE/ParE family toxin [Acidobacteriota bacterium]